MKFSLLILCFLISGFSMTSLSTKDFDNRLSYIVNAFTQGIMDKSECEKQNGNARELYYDIEDEIKKDYMYTPDEINTLKTLKKETEAIEEYIAAIGNCNTDLPLSIEKFNLANRRVGGYITNVVTDKYCMDVISVSIGGYIAYLIKNNSTEDQKAEYKWKTPNGMNSGSGTFGLLKKSVRHFYNNHKIHSQKSITVFGITCKEY